jgi:hypothetical protein
MYASNVTGVGRRSSRLSRTNGMRPLRHLLTLTFLTLSLPLWASWWPQWSTTDLQLYVGQKVVVRVTPTWSGLVDYGGVHWTFASDSPSVATGVVTLDSPTPQDFDVAGVSPGIAHIRQNASGWPYVTIRVSCFPEKPAVAAQPVMTTQLGREVQLSVVTEYENRSTFHWYRGKVGDTSTPIGASGSETSYKPDAGGSHYIWAEVTTACSTTQVQFRVDVAARQRAARH